MDRVTIVCVKQGSKYGPEYANNLWAAIERNATLPHQFVCVTDDPTGLLCPSLPLRAGLTGWWSKLTLFQPDPYGITGVILYFDLDTLIVGSIDDLIALDSDFCILRDFTRPDRYGSGVFRLRVGSQKQVWEKFTPEDQERVGIYGDQEWIWEQVPRADLWPASWCVSYKEHCQAGPPPGARVICFHGEPKPHNAPAAWVQGVWSPPANRPSLGPPGASQAYSLAGPEPGGKGLRTHIFGGQVRYHCPDCGFDHYDVGQVNQHWMLNHGGQQQSLGPTLFDAKGDEIKREIRVPKELEAQLASRLHRA